MAASSKALPDAATPAHPGDPASQGGWCPEARWPAPTHQAGAPRRSLLLGPARDLAGARLQHKAQEQVDGRPALTTGCTVSLHETRALPTPPEQLTPGRPGLL